MSGCSRWMQNQEMNSSSLNCTTTCYQWPHRPPREGDPLRQLNRCCDPSCCIERSLPRPCLIYSCPAVNDLDTASVSLRSHAPYRHDPKFINLHDGEWDSAGPSKSKNQPAHRINWSALSFDERERHSRRLRENYEREIQALKAKLKVLKNTANDTKRSRYRSESESECCSFSQRRTYKRIRDTSPPDPYSRHRQPRPSTLAARSNFKRETRSMPPRLTSSVPPKQVSCSTVSVQTSSEEVGDSYPSDCEDNGSENMSAGSVSVSDSIENISEDDVSIQSDVTSPSNGSNQSSEKSNVDGGAVAASMELMEGACSIQTESRNVFRRSLFPNVPPYLIFASHDVKGPTLPVEISKILRWRLSTITPVVIRRTLTNTGFRFVRKSNDWTGQWGKHMHSFLFKTLKNFQKLNHFPGTFHIGRKDKLWKNLNRLMLKFGKKEFGFIPTTYVLPQDSKNLRVAWEKTSGKGQWIVKPPAAARGTGIRVVHRWCDVPKNKPLIVQKYISQPYLINGSKFDLRLYVLMTSIHPLRIYLYDDGLVRFASVKYSNNVESLSDRFMHLTNYSINKLSNQYCANEDASSCQGHKWTLKSLWIYLKARGINVAEIQKNLTDLVIKTIISGESHIQALAKNNLPSRYCSYELFGIDVLLDSNLRPWLLEVNISPSLHSSSPLDLAVKGPLVTELLNLAGFQVPAKLSKEQEMAYLDACELGGTTSRFCFDKRLYTTTLSREERMKHASYNVLPRTEYLSSILEKLTADDVRHLIQFEDEVTQLQRFEKVFPTPGTHSYHQYFESPRYYNMLLDAWECRYYGDRGQGISLLQPLCRLNYHLQVPFTGSKTRTCGNKTRSQGKAEEIEAEEAEDQEGREEGEKSLQTQIKRRKRLGVARSGIRSLVSARKLRASQRTDSKCLRVSPSASPVLSPPKTLLSPDSTQTHFLCSTS